MHRLIGMWREAPASARALAGAFFRFVAPYLYPTGKRVEVEGVSFRVGVRSLGSYRRAAEFSHREGRFTTAFLAEARSAPVIYDIGAHVGYYVLLASKANPNARVFAFEPQGANFSELESNLVLNRVSNVTPFKCGVSSVDGASRLAVSGSSARSGSGTHKLSAHGSGEEVVVISLDSFVSERGLPPPSVILMDIEGHELAALRGMMRLLVDHKPTLYLEVHRDQLKARGESQEQLESLLRGLGYESEVLRSPTGEPGTHSQTHIRYVSNGGRL